VFRRSPKRVLSDLGRRVAELRAANGETQEQLAERLGWWPRQVQRIEAGQANLSVESVAELALALGADVAELFDPPTNRKKPGPGRPPRA
jgi:transcriptional regulator with XRE-family HTH domain